MCKRHLVFWYLKVVFCRKRRDAVGLHRNVRLIVFTIEAHRD